MTASAERNLSLPSGSFDAHESPFLGQELFTARGEESELRLGELEKESPFFQVSPTTFDREILGTDDRTVVNGTLGIPNRWICAIDVITGDSSQHIRGTGILIGPRYVLTAKHIWPLDANELFVSPARNGSNSNNPFGRIKAKGFRYPLPYSITLPLQPGSSGGTHTTIRQDDDYMLIILEQDLSSNTFSGMQGTLGYWGQDSAQATIRIPEPATMQGREVVVIGYPGDTCGTQKFLGSTSQKLREMKNCVRTRKNEWASKQWRSMGILNLETNVPNRMYHTADTYEGQSGSPIVLTTGHRFDLVGLHVDRESDQRNLGLRITERMLLNLCTWINTDTGRNIATIRDGALLIQTAPASGGSSREFFFYPEEGENTVEDSGEFEGDEAGHEFDTPAVLSKDLQQALDSEKWPLALNLAIQEGIRSENDLTNLIFFKRYPAWIGHKLDPKKSKEEAKLSQEWMKILRELVRPAREQAATDATLKVTAKYVLERDKDFVGESGQKFKEVVEWAAKEADINPGFLAAVLLAEWDRKSTYLSAGEVRSFLSGVDDFFAQKDEIRKNVPAFSQIRFDPAKKSTDVNEHGRLVTTIPFKSGKDAVLATAVYLKYGEIKLRTAFQKNGGDFDKLPIETRLALVRIAMAAGHGGISPDGELIRFKQQNKKWRRVKPGEKGGVLRGVASRVGRVLNGEDILVRKNEKRAYPSTAHITNRNATILVAQAMHLSDWIFGIRLSPTTQPELEDAEQWTEEETGLYDPVFETSFTDDEEPEQLLEEQDDEIVEESEHISATELDEFLYEAEEEDKQFIEQEAPPLLNDRLSDPPGQTKYVEIDLGTDIRCLAYQNGQCSKWSKPFQIKRETGIFIPKHYAPQSEIDLILYLHGHKGDIPGGDSFISEYWNAAHYPFFGLREEINASGKNIILVAPTLGLYSESGKLTKGTGLDTYLNQVLEALISYGPYKGKPTQIGKIVLAAHSGAGHRMSLLTSSANKYAAKIKECWGLDSLYWASDKDTWIKWASLNPSATYYNFHFKPTPTKNSDALRAAIKQYEKRKKVSLENIRIIPATSGHYEVVREAFRQRLNDPNFLKS